MAEDYEDKKRRARDPDPAVRAALASDPDTPPELLFFLAEDPNPDVRHQVALNEMTPRQADLLLTRDDDANIRRDLANKIAHLTPDLPADRQSTLYKLTVQALEVLAEDQIVRVREILAETLKDVANAPSGVILKLAKDTELSVASPILEFSPVLSDSDLLDIIGSGPIQGAMNAIARRSALGDSVSDAIARSGDDDAITTLLSNRSAQIREETLDFIIDHAPERVAWHEPLAMRPRLSPRAAQRIASFIAMNLLDRMQQRLDLDDATLVAVAEAVEGRLAEETKRRMDEPEWTERDDLEDHIERLYKTGGLNSQSLERALSQGEKRFALRGMAKLSGLKLKIVERMVFSGSPKAGIALTWKAGLKPDFAELVQSQLMSLSPIDAISIQDGRWPMQPDTMEWQIEFYTKAAV